MLEFVEGTVESLTPTSVVLANGGLGYLIQVSSATYGALQGRERVRLFVHQVIREDAQGLYGFATAEERALFRLLISVSGVGPSTGRMILSAYETAELVGYIEAGDEGALKRVKGIGLKTAQRVIVDLREKVANLGVEPAGIAGQSNKAKAEALSALVTLGFPRAASEKTLSQLLAKDGALTVEQLIRLALKQL